MLRDANQRFGQTVLMITHNPAAAEDRRPHHPHARWLHRVRGRRPAVGSGIRRVGSIGIARISVRWSGPAESPCRRTRSIYAAAGRLSLSRLHIAECVDHDHLQSDPMPRYRIDRAFSARYNSFIQLSGSNSVVECDLAKVEVAGSTPVSRSIICSLLPLAPARVYALSFGSGRGTQVVRERSAKPLCVGSIPTRASKISLRHSTIAPFFISLSLWPAWSLIQITDHRMYRSRDPSLGDLHHGRYRLSGDILKGCRKV